LALRKSFNANHLTFQTVEDGFKGIDNRCYYRLLQDNLRYYINDTGTGNTLNLSHGRVIQMVLDSLRYWVEQTKVDGFRFDLGTILAREPNGLTTRADS
jgi:isoamylase